MDTPDAYNEKQNVAVELFYPRNIHQRMDLRMSPSLVNPHRSTQFLDCGWPKAYGQRGQDRPFHNLTRSDTLTFTTDISRLHDYVCNQIYTL
jgi:hypothetical protein